MLRQMKRSIEYFHKKRKHTPLEAKVVGLTAAQGHEELFSMGKKYYVSAKNNPSEIEKYNLLEAAELCFSGAVLVDSENSLYQAMLELVKKKSRAIVVAKEIDEKQEVKEVKLSTVPSPRLFQTHHLWGIFERYKQAFTENNAENLKSAFDDNVKYCKEVRKYSPRAGNLDSLINELSDLQELNPAEYLVQKFMLERLRVLKSNLKQTPTHGAPKFS